MDYKKHYNKLILSRGRKQREDSDEYLEQHHIVPRCQGGNDSLDNLVYLTVREHILAHFLLWKIDKTNKQLARSFGFMSAGVGRNPTSVVRALMDKAKSESAIGNLFATGNKSWSGRNHNQETKMLISRSMKGNKNLLGHKFAKRVCDHCSKSISINNFNQHKCFRKP